MSFVSFAFLVLFAVVLASRLTIGRTKTEPIYLAVLIAASAIFYAWHVPAYISLLLGSTLIDYFAARRIVLAPPASIQRRAALVVSLSANLGILGAFKYADFFVQEVAALLGILGMESSLPVLGLALPLGISFYTFQSMSYTIDVYRGRLQPVEHFWQLFLFVSFFPQLVAGPIVRARQFLYQIGRRRTVNFQVMSEGVFLLIRGFFLKMVCANNLAPFVDDIFSGAADETNSSVLVLGSVFFMCQIFCDFAGYSSIARGLAYILGFRLPVNFNNPFISQTFAEIWQRWHITLSQWLRDYLFFPLGGRRRSKYRANVSIVVVMLLCGLWHGAAWTFIFWGGLQGVALLIERIMGLNRIRRKTNSAILIVAWYLFVQVYWFTGGIIFRSPDIDLMSAYFFNLFSGNIDSISREYWFPLVVGVAPVFLMHFRGFLTDRNSALRVGATEKAVLSGLMLIATLSLYGVESEFIYFQF